MLDEKQKKESSYLIKQLISENKIIKPEEGRKTFFINKSIESFSIAKRILEISQEENDPLRSYMWVVSISYYSIFFAATALLAHFNHRIDDNRGIHKLTYHALIYYFLIDDNKLEKYFVEEYKDAYDEAEELLQVSRSKAVSLIKFFDYPLKSAIPLPLGCRCSAIATSAFLGS